MAASEGALPDGMTMPSSDALAKELGHDPREFKKNVEDFATALSQGNQSQALKRLCAKDEQSCELIRDFQNQAADAKGERKRARKKGRYKINENKLADAQKADFHMLINSLKVQDEYKLFSIAEKALQVPGCPRNLSAALAIKTEEYFPFPKARELSKQLFNHARQCLSEDSVVYERLYLRQGLYALYEGDKGRAKDMLLLAKKAKANTERYRVLYWLGRMAHDAGTKPAENQDWNELLNEFPLSYYAIDASVAQGKDPMETITQRKVGGLKREVADDPELNRMIRWLEALYIYKKPGAVAKWAGWIVRANENDLDVDVIQYLSTLKVAAGLYRSNITMLFSYFRKNPQALNAEGLKLLYPRPYYSLIEEASRGKIDTFLVMGLVRQESAFDSQAISRVKAKGLMQIIPQTARHLASQGHKKLLNERENTKMGVKYLLQLSDRFNGSAELVLAAYNAGPLKVDEWMKRNPERDSNMLLWNDLIPFMETRDYVVSILRNNYLYTRLYGAPQEDTAALFQSSLVRRLLASAAPAKAK
jgi:soluble lytic murein transglycosylase-like protein